MLVLGAGAVGFGTALALLGVGTAIALVGVTLADAVRAVEISNFPIRLSRSRRMYLSSADYYEAIYSFKDYT